MIKENDLNVAVVIVVFGCRFCNAKWPHFTDNNVVDVDFKLLLFVVCTWVSISLIFLLDCIYANV